MKKIIFLAILIFATIGTIAQANKTVKKTDTKQDSTQDVVAKEAAKSESIWVRESDIPPSALKNLQRDSKIQQVENKLEEINNYVGIGKEIGGAIDTSLGALAFHIDEISKTNVGKFTMLMVAWKIVGEDFSGYFSGLIIYLIFLGIWIWSWHQNFYKRQVPAEARIFPWKDVWYKPWKRREVTKWQPYEKQTGNFNTAISYGNAGYTGHLITLIFATLFMFLIMFA